MKFTKKAIVAALKEIYKQMDRTALFKFYHDVTGERGFSNDWNPKMRNFFKPFCTSERMTRSIGVLCDTKCLAEIRNNRFEMASMEFYGERPCPNLAEVTRRERARALKMLRRLHDEPLTNYTKVPMFGMTHLYFCSPSYGHKDYNKVRTCLLNGPLAVDKDGNRYDPQAAWCQKVLELGNRIYVKKVAGSRRDSI